MGVKPHVQTAIYLIWIMLVPAGMWFTYQTFPPHLSGNWHELIAFLALMAIVASMPIIINNVPIFLIQWVSFTVFLIFGLFVEMVFAQIAVLVLLVKLRVPKDQLFRIPLNLIMFFLVSFFSGTFYYLIGGQTAPRLTENSEAFLLAILYAVLNYFINQVIVSFNLFFIYKRKNAYFGKDLLVETLTTIITIPVGVVLYILYNELGLLSLLFVGIPFVSLSVIFNLYYSSEKINQYLQKTGEIGHQMAERLQVDDVVTLFIQKLGGMLPVDYAYVFEVSGDELKLIRYVEEGRVDPYNRPPLKKNEGISGMVWAKQKACFFSRKKEWTHITSGGYLPKDARSILSVPIMRNKMVIGVLLLASKQERAYEKYQLTIVDILCSYFAVAMENAKHYERTKMQSERCSLTKLFNYRYFENALMKEFEQLKRYERDVISLIILDIDHFKTVNDTYGHQSGNEILIDIAGRISKLVGSRGTVARYGGEEFVVLLPDVSKGEAYQTAELIRESIANWPFTLYETIDQDQKKQQVKITASIGVATAPEDAEDALALIRHADRALYVGAKRAGRNRVAEYSSC
ncbi:sensor domain-containing diguanylate cyclase [Neobacillus rhizophilus]|uniref:Diguanylate cyclase n=1 Tax=Neobacillus rhizophilus TaxID=2833579 RepID=A0A942U9L4_9BACI|nr:sensor domain-containing diguanylate cyclase [Neobacillus rhizophilus]MBS4215467.1 diguanylate cyclase [Neobacillus rhizophilus]